jgi:hypothetical protein
MIYAPFGICRSLGLKYFYGMNDRETEQEEVRQELRRKQSESARLKTEKQEKLERFIHRVTWYLSMPIVVFAIALVLDGLLPATALNENIVKSFQEQRSAGRRHNDHLRSFIETDHYQIPAPEGVTLNFSGKNDPKPPITIYVTPFFKIPVEFTLSDNSTEVLEVPRTIHTMGFPLKWILLISSLLTLFMKALTKFSYALCFLPVLLLAITLLIM